MHFVSWYRIALATKCAKSHTVLVDYGNGSAHVVGCVCLSICRPAYNVGVLWLRAPRYLGPLIRVDDLPDRRPLRSTNTNVRLVVPQVKLSTVGSRAFAVAAADIWNRLPTDVVAANSLSAFRLLLKRFLFRQSYPDVVYWHHLISDPCSGHMAVPLRPF